MKVVCGTIEVDEDHHHPAIHRQRFPSGQEQQRPAGRPARRWPSRCHHNVMGFVLFWWWSQGAAEDCVVAGCC